MKKLFSLTLLLVLTGCPSMPAQQAPAFDNAAAQRAVFDAFGKYKLAVIVADTYVNLKLCTAAPPPCATLSVVRVIQKAQPAARAVLDASELTVRTPGFGNDVYDSAVTSAKAALVAFESITNTLGVK